MRLGLYGTPLWNHLTPCLVTLLHSSCKCVFTYMWRPTTKCMNIGWICWLQMSLFSLFYSRALSLRVYFIINKERFSEKSLLENELRIFEFQIMHDTFTLHVLRCFPNNRTKRHPKSGSCQCAYCICFRALLLYTHLLYCIAKTLISISFYINTNWCYFIIIICVMWTQCLITEGNM